jgi:hypothetical protein
LPAAFALVPVRLCQQRLIKETGQRRAIDEA